MITLLRIHLRTIDADGIELDHHTWCAGELPPPVLLRNWQRDNKAMAASMVGWECVTPKPKDPIFPADAAPGTKRAAKRRVALERAGIVP